jgi:hypothetical protein
MFCLICIMSNLAQVFLFSVSPFCIFLSLYNYVSSHQFIWRLWEPLLLCYATFWQSVLSRSKHCSTSCRCYGWAGRQLWRRSGWKLSAFLTHPFTWTTKWASYFRKQWHKFNSVLNPFQQLTFRELQGTYLLTHYLVYSFKSNYEGNIHTRILLRVWLVQLSDWQWICSHRAISFTTSTIWRDPSRV